MWFKLEVLNISFSAKKNNFNFLLNENKLFT